jgi:GH24 family phage-related lysozyme (muramidase)
MKPLACALLLLVGCGKPQDKPGPPGTINMMDFAEGGSPVCWKDNNGQMFLGKGHTWKECAQDLAVHLEMRDLREKP